MKTIAIHEVNEGQQFIVRKNGVVSVSLNREEATAVHKRFGELLDVVGESDDFAKGWDAAVSMMAASQAPAPIALPAKPARRNRSFTMDRASRI